jgi:predicted TIM-barrel fold metal-dependent hydrolase
MFEPPSPPRFAVPSGSCDCHVHQFGPFARYPLDRRRLYTPDPALASDLIAMLDGAGVARAVLVQPSAYGTDNRCMLDAMAEHPRRFRGVVVIDPNVTEPELARMHALGVRGAFVTLDIIAAIAPLVRRLPVDVVFDHMGMAKAARGVAQPGLSTLVDLMQTGRVWVKLSGPYRVSDDVYGNAQVTELARALIAANRDRVVWGSDWPHIGSHPHHVDDNSEPPHSDYRQIDYGRLLSALADWADGDDIARILARNPAKLYDFA